MAIKVKPVRFPLILKDGTKARSLKDLREHGDLESILKHYQEGTLSRWLNAWKYEGELEKIKEIGRRFLENKQECLRGIFEDLAVALDENQFREYCKTNLGDPSSLFDKDTYKSNDSGVSIKEKLTEFLPKDFSADSSAGQGLEDWEVTELQLDEDNVQIEFSCEKEGFSASLEYKKDETLYKKVASMLVSQARLCVSKNDVVIEQKEEKKEIITSDSNPIKDTPPQKELTSKQRLNNEVGLFNDFEELFIIEQREEKKEIITSDFNLIKDTTPQKELTSEQLLNLRKLTIKDGILERCVNSIKGEVIIPKSVTEIGDGAFEGCSFLTSVEIPQGVTKIGVRAFFRCSSLKSVVIPKNVTKIGSYAFSGCSSLSSVEMFEGVREIGSHVFSGCRSLYGGLRQKLKSLGYHGPF